MVGQKRKPLHSVASKTRQTMLQCTDINTDKQRSNLAAVAMDVVQRQQHLGHSIGRLTQTPEDPHSSQGVKRRTCDIKCEFQLPFRCFYTAVMMITTEALVETPFKSRACTGRPRITLTKFLQRRDSVEKLPTLRTKKCQRIGM